MMLSASVVTKLQQTIIVCVNSQVRRASGCKGLEPFFHAFIFGVAKVLA